MSTKKEKALKNSTITLYPEPTVNQLFPTPVMFCKLPRKFTDEEVAFVQKCSQNVTKNTGNTTSVDRYIFEEPVMKDLKSFVQFYVNHYMENIESPYNPVEAYITQSWLNYTQPGEFHHKHEHPNSYISGVLYINADPEKDKIYFKPFFFLPKTTAEEYENQCIIKYGATLNTNKSYVTEEETKEITYKLSDAGRLFQTINPMTLNRIAASDVVLTHIKTFNNTKVRAGQSIKDTRAHTIELIKWVEDKLNKEIVAAKKPETKRKRQTEKNEIMRFYRGNAGELKKIFDLQNDIVESKNMIIKKLQQIKQVTGAFLKTEDGFKVTDPEGFVAVDKLKGNAVKLVDRLGFSQANFNAQKNWSN